MRYDPVQRLQLINEALVNLVEFGPSRAAQRERERTGKGEMVTGLDGKQYPLGADPTRARPGSALYIENQKKAAAGRPETVPGLRGVPLTAPDPTPRQAPRPAAPVAPAQAAPGTVAYGTQNQRPSYVPDVPSAPTFSGMARGTAAQGLFDGKPAARVPAAPTAPKAQGNIQMPAAAATALGQGDPAMQAYVSTLDQGDPWRGQTKKPEAKPAAPAAPDPAASYSGMGSLNYDPTKTPPTVAPSAPSATKSGGFNTAGMGPRTIQSLTGSGTKPSQPDKGFNVGSLMMTGSTPPVITSPAIPSSGLASAASSVAGYNGQTNSRSSAPKAPKNAANLDPRFSTQPMDPATGLPVNLSPKASPTQNMPNSPKMPDSWAGNFTPPPVNTSRLAGTIQVARPDEFPKTTKPDEALTPFEKWSDQVSPTNPLTWTPATAAATKGIVDGATWLSQRFSHYGDLTPKDTGRSGIEFGITNKSRKDYFQAERNRKKASEIKYEPPHQPEKPITTRTVSEQTNFSAPKEYNIKNKGSIESFLFGRR